MSVLRLLIDVLGPVVLIVGLGATLGHRLGVEVGSLSKLAYWILGPAFAIDLFAESTLAGETALRLSAAAIVGMVAAALVAWGAATLIGLSPSERSADVMTSAYGNVGNAGLAISAFALGDEVLPAAGVLMIVINMAGMTLGITLATSQSGGLLKGVRTALLAPMTIAAFVALVLNLADASLPLVADRTIGLLAGALIPVMLLALGIQLAITGLRAPSSSLAASTIAKLAVAPAVATGAAWLLGLSGDDLGVVAIQSAMPPAVFCLVVATEHDLERDRVTTNVVTMTALALVTLPVVLALTGS